MDTVKKTTPSKNSKNNKPQKTPKNITKTGKPLVLKKKAVVPTDTRTLYLNPDNFINRELSWLDFNNRVMEEAQGNENPLLERIKFLAIVCSNLDEFFMVRVASLKELLHANYTEPDASGLTPRQQLLKISEKTHTMVEKTYSIYNRSMLPKLKKKGIHILSWNKLTKEQADFTHKYFQKQIYPVITPMAADSARPFPLVANKKVNICALLRKQGSRKVKYRFVTLEVPSVLPRLIQLPGKSGEQDYILLETIIREHIKQMFTGYSVVSSGVYRIMRNADLSIDEEDAQDLLKKIQKSIKKRRWGEVIRLDVEAGMDPRLLNTLQDELNLTGNEDLYPVSGPIDLTFLFKLYDLIEDPSLKYKPFTPLTPSNDWDNDIFSVIRQGDMFLHHPYDSFDPVVDFVRQAASDPDVLAIKQTLYRVSGHSPIVRELSRAAENGKQVMVLVEVKARFDEENNINWAHELDKAGCHVIYGLVGLKTHSKITMVVRREGNDIRRYVHLGTGNYNDSTAKIYTDMSLFTCEDKIGEDATEAFNLLSGYSESPKWNDLILAPIWLRSKITELIRNEAENARKGMPAEIIMKMNSLVDPLMIAELYEASNAGVKIQLIVRGICCLKAGVPGLSDNISVRSLVGRFLEHSRVYWFKNNGDDRLFLSSADLMPRNLERRVEIMFPIKDKAIQETIKEIVNLQLNDTQRARIMQKDTTYIRKPQKGKKAVDTQKILMERSIDMLQEQNKILDATVQAFIPIEVNKPAES